MSECAREMCIQHNTKQCAAICLSHSCLIPLGECPSLLDVWTPEAIQRWKLSGLACAPDWSSDEYGR
jgi:hypothetical protein